MRRIILYGHFGSGNIGNDCTLEAAIFHIRRHQPEVELICVCSGPEEVSRRFGIKAVSMDGAHAGVRPSGDIASRAGRIAWRLVDEIRFWFRQPSQYRAGDLLVVVGTGAVDDMAVRRPWHAPYQLYKWCKTAKLGRAQVIFLSVGVGPIENRVSRFLMLKALALADYRSYRETAAFRYLDGLGRSTNGDQLYPDLGFSFPKESLPAGSGRSGVKTIGIGLINYQGWKHDPRTGAAVYHQYIAKIKRLIVSLLDKGFDIRILWGDTTDRAAIEEIRALIQDQGSACGPKRVVIESIESVYDLFEQIRQTDIVVASRFHNLLCSLLLGIPVISVGYHEKNSDLMREMGLEQYCNDIEQFSVEAVEQQLEQCLTELEPAAQRIQKKQTQYREMLDRQYCSVFA